MTNRREWPGVELGRWKATDELPAGPVFQSFPGEEPERDPERWETETYVPLSALLDPEVVEAARKACGTTREWATLALDAASQAIKERSERES